MFGDKKMNGSSMEEKNIMEKNKQRSNLAKPYIRAFYKNNHLNFIIAIVLRIAFVPAILGVSWLLGAVVDVIDTGEYAQLLRLLKIAVIGIVVFTVVEVVFYRAYSSFIHKALAQYKALAFQKLSEKGISAFSQESTGRYISVLTNDVNTIEENYLTHFFDLVDLPITFFGALALMLWCSPILTLAAVILCLLPFCGILVFGQEFSRREKAVSDKNEDFVSKLKDLLSGFAVIKSFKAEKEARGIFDVESIGLEETKRRRRWWQGLLSSVSSSLGITMQFGIFFIGAYLAIRGAITAGTVLIFVNLCNSLIQPVQQVPQYLAARKAARGLIEKLAQIVEENASRAGDAIKPVLNDSIELTDVTFGYEEDKPVLKNLSLRLDAGKKYALVGASGSGKSTLLNLLMGAFSNYEGNLKLDGKELKTVDPDSLYDVMSLIGQNVFIFDDTIKDNITMFRDFPEKDIADAIRRSGLASLIKERGEDYRCGENGNGLSGGERQRISIARSLLRGTPVLLLDEATAALDNQTAFTVTDAILHLDGLTRLVVTHRLEETLLKQYDVIFVLRDGVLWECGSFEELMEKREYFYSLYTVSNG